MGTVSKNDEERMPGAFPALEMPTGTTPPPLDHHRSLGMVPAVRSWEGGVFYERGIPVNPEPSTRGGVWRGTFPKILVSGALNLTSWLPRS